MSALDPRLEDHSVTPNDPLPLIARRRAAWAERVRLSEDRWTRFQAANRKRYGHRAARRLNPPLARLMARAKTPGRMLLLHASGLWEPDLEASLGSAPGPTTALGDYVRAGPDAAAQPRALFDQRWYLERAPALAATRWPPLAHYLVVGDGCDWSPHPLFDVSGYRSRHGAAMRVGNLTGLEHFVFEGAAAGANPHPLFDLRHYVGQSEELAKTGENPLIHYLRAGWREGLDPHPLFAGDWYLSRYPQAEAAGVAPLLHYVTLGAGKGLDPHPLFDATAYAQERRGRLAADPLVDYLATGARALKSPTPHFRPAYYLDQTRDQLARADPLQHYLTTGTFEGLWPAPDFDEPSYLAACSDAEGLALSGLEHWVRQRTERPTPSLAGAGRVTAEVLFEDLRRASVGDPDAYDNAAYEALRRERTPARPREPVRVIAIRHARAPDWAAVARALPNYHGHLQPRLPADGFTVPTDPATLKRDIALARRYGLDAFCHEISSPELADEVSAVPHPFCLAWNGAADAAQAIPALASPFAVRIDGKPVLLLPAQADPFQWRKTGELFLIRRGGGPAAGFDAFFAEPLATRSPEGPPGPMTNRNFRGVVHDHRSLVAEQLTQELAAEAIPLVVVAHDTTPRSQDAPVVWQGASPGALQAWLETASDAVRGRLAARRLVFIHAWNDWETGAALSPDLRFGHGWLEAVANAADADLLTPAKPRRPR